MTYNVYYTKLKQWDEESFKEDKDAVRSNADHMGFLLMYVQLNEITKDNLEEIIFRLRFADTLHGSSYLKKKDGSEFTLKELREILKDHIGLSTNMTVSTRHQFIVNVAKGKASDVDYKLRQDLCGVES